MSKNLKENKLDSYARKHVVLHKKGFIIGTVCAGLALAGAGGTAIYFGVTRKTGNVDNSITFEEANKFAHKNYKLTADDVEKNGKANAKSAVASWDFTKTEGINDTEKGSAGDIFQTQLKPLIEGLLEKGTEVKTKNENEKINKDFCEYITDESLIASTGEAFLFINTYTMYGYEEDEVVFHSSDHYNLRKNGDNITYTTDVNLVPSSYGTAYNRVDCTLTKDGKVQKVYIPIYGTIFDESNPVFNADITITFTY